MGLIHQIYTSVAARPIEAPELEAILETSRANNRAADVSGMLLYSNRSFFQILEGPETAVDDVYARIAADPRHGELRTLVREAILRRGFGEWAMGHAEASEADFAALAGVHDLQSASTFLATLEDGQARRLMAAFVQGRWRSRLSDSGTRQARRQVP